MTRKDALEDLLAKVEAGELESWREPVVAFGPPIDDRNFLAQVAYNGSLDAAKALHEAVMIGHDWLVRPDEDTGGFANVTTHDFAWHAEYDGATELKNVVDLGASFPAYAETPARAWLIAILRALISQE